MNNSSGLSHIHDQDYDIKIKRMLWMWRWIVKSYFKDLDKKALEYRLNDTKSGVKVFENDGTIFEVTINPENGILTALLCLPDDGKNDSTDNQLNSTSELNITSYETPKYFNFNN